MPNSDDKPKPAPSKTASENPLESSQDSSSTEPLDLSDIDVGLAAAYQDSSSDELASARATYFPEPGMLIAEKYKLIEQIGEGGMGTVWYAEQLFPVKRKVALKLIKPGMDSRGVMARFEAERQALALMDHPNIAKVFDGGITEQGRPYFAMELVRGTAITAFCDTRKLDLYERLRLFIPVCQAIQHAHQKGIIHRDIKPSNVMIALYDDKPVPKVIDFGVAKSNLTDLSDASVNTGFGSVVGTMEYMSPEQAQLNNVDIDTRSDVYSLGVLLYELLAGSPPFRRTELAERGIVEVLRVIREVDPQLPSTKLSSSKMRASIAALRNTPPDALGKLLRSDLDWIVMKSLEKDRSRRYESASGLARDIDRFLANETVEACPPSTTYKVRKFLRRNRAFVFAAAMVILALLAGIVGTSYGLYRAEEARREAVSAQRSESKRAESERLAKQEALAQKELAEKAEAEAFESYRASFDDAITQLIGSKPELIASDRKYLENAIRRWQAFTDRKGDDERSLAIRGESHREQGDLWEMLGNSVESQSNYEKAAQIWDQLIADFPADPKYRHSRATVHHDFSILLERIGKRKEAEEQLKLAQKLKESLVAEYPNSARFRETLARNYLTLGNLLKTQQKNKEAEEEFRKSIAIRKELAEEFLASSEYRWDLAISYSFLAAVLKSQGKRLDSEQNYRKALVDFEINATGIPMQPKYKVQFAMCLRGLGLLLVQLDKTSEAEELYRKSMFMIGSLATEFPNIPSYQRDLATMHQSLGILLVQLKRDIEAEGHYREAISISTRLSEQFPSMQEFQTNLTHDHYNFALFLRRLKNRKEAEDHHRKALSIVEKMLERFPEDRESLALLADVRNGIGILLYDQENRSEAEQEYRKSTAIREKLYKDFSSVPAYAVDLGGSYCNLALLLRDDGKFEESVLWFDKAINILRPLYEKDNRVQRIREYLRNSHWGRAKTQLLLHQYSQTDWDQAVLLSKEERQPHFRLLRADAMLRTENLEAAVKEVADLIALPTGGDTGVPLWSSTDLYDIACLVSVASQKSTDSQQEYADKAMVQLRRAIEAGYSDVAHMKQDTDLDPLRDRDDFKEFLAELDAKP